VHPQPIGEHLKLGQMSFVETRAAIGQNSEPTVNQGAGNASRGE